MVIGESDAICQIKGCGRCGIAVEGRTGAFADVGKLRESIAGIVCIHIRSTRLIYNS